MTDPAARSSVAAAAADAIADRRSPSVAAYVAVRSQLRDELDSAPAGTGRRRLRHCVSSRAAEAHLDEASRDRAGRGTCACWVPPQARFGRRRAACVQLLAPTGGPSRPRSAAVPTAVTRSAASQGRTRRGVGAGRRRSTAGHLRVLTGPLAGVAPCSWPSRWPKRQRPGSCLPGARSSVAAGGVACAALPGALVARAGLAPGARLDRRRPRRRRTEADPSRRCRPGQGRAGRLARTYNAMLAALSAPPTPAPAGRRRRARAAHPADQPADQPGACCAGDERRITAADRERQLSAPGRADRRLSSSTTWWSWRGEESPSIADDVDLQRRRGEP